MSQATPPPLTGFSRRKHGGAYARRDCHRTGSYSLCRAYVFHEVKDVQHWLSSPTREEFFGPLGVTEIKTYIDPEGSKQVGVSMNVSNMESVIGAVETAEGAAAMERDGVIPETMVILIES